VASDGKEALALYAQYTPDVLLLDIDMPYVDGIQIAQQIREENTQVIIVMLTALTDTQRLLDATELNLCKYLVKPVSPKAFKEVLQKVSQRLSQMSSSFISLQENYKWERSKEILYHHQKKVILTQKEKLLLSLLLKHHQKSVSFEEIMAIVWENDFDTEISIDTVKFHVSQLRKKLPLHSIKSVYGKGYIFL